MSGSPDAQSVRREAHRLLGRHMGMVVTPAGERGTVRIKDAVDAIVVALAARAVAPTREGDEARAREVLASLIEQQGSSGSAYQAAAIRKGETGWGLNIDRCLEAMLAFAAQPRAEAGEGVELAEMVQRHADRFRNVGYVEGYADELDRVATYLRAPSPTPLTPEPGKPMVRMDGNWIPIGPRRPGETDDTHAVGRALAAHNGAMYIGDLTRPTPTPEPDALAKADNRYPAVFYGASDSQRIKVAHYRDANGTQPFVTVGVLLENKPGGPWVELEVLPDEAEQLALHLMKKVASVRATVPAATGDRA